MSRLTETQRAYAMLVQLLDQEIRKRTGPTRDLERFRETLDVAFYLLGWSQFEYLVRQETKDLIDQKSKVQTVERHAWQYLQDNLKALAVRRRLDLIFHTIPTVRAQLDKDYELRNDVAHNYRYLPREAKDVSAWLLRLEDLVEKFEALR
jgi:hypothetical protein